MGNKKRDRYWRKSELKCTLCRATAVDGTKVIGYYVPSTTLALHYILAVSRTGKNKGLVKIDPTTLERSLGRRNNWEPVEAGTLRYRASVSEGTRKGERAYGSYICLVETRNGETQKNHYIQTYQSNGKVGYMLHIDPTTLEERPQRRQVMFHATYGKRIPSIMEHGLGGVLTQSNWDESITSERRVFLAETADSAISFAETADCVPKEVYDSGIVVLAVNVKDLYLRRDPYVVGPYDTYLYKGIIGKERISVHQSVERR